MKQFWDRQGGEIAYDAGIFRVRKDRYGFRGRPAGHPFHVIEAADWVNVVAVTDAAEVVLVRQFRHGVGQDCLEVPGGVIDPSDPDPAAAAIRELREETGYAGDPPRGLGSVSSNPAILTNRTYSFWMPAARLVGDPQPDTHEALETELCPVARIPALIESGAIHHALAVVALLRFLRAVDT
jgi:8-oxo-dGTP pyrophosphatase MutT (NUDIX family)